MKKTLILAVSAIAGTATCFSEITLPDIFSDNMVLQQTSDAKIWGWANPGKAVQLQPSWTKAPVNTVAGADGRWEATVRTPRASYQPYSLRISGDGSDIELGNILMGEVWFCSGQSNMEMPLRGFWTQPVENAAQAIAYSGKYKGVRMATVPKTGAATPQDRTEGKWKESNPQNAPDFSALAYFFATSLNDILDVPVGIINCSYGGTKVESWMPKEIVAGYDDIDVDAEIAGTANVDDWHRAVIRYNSMLYPLAGYTIKGFLWNQGESNVGKHDTYPERINTMVAHWRGLWGNDSLPFYQVEIPGWNYGDPNGDAAAKFRECQHMAAQMMEHGDIVCTSDLVYPYELEDIHASQKQPIGERLAFMAAANDYGLPTIAHIYPRLQEYSLEGDKAVLRIDNTYGYLSPNDYLEGFEVAGEDMVFHPAEAVVDNNNQFKVVVSSPEVSDIKSVRYCFKNFCIGKVHSLEGLPLVPFRTDSW